jgi:integrase
MRLCPAYPGNPRRYIEGESPHSWRDIQSIGVIDDIAAERGEVAADRARTALSGLFSWAIERGYCEINPTLNLGARANGGARDRVLTESELVEVWHACEDDDYGRIVRLLILTGQRKTEIGDVLWPEVQKDRRQIDLPAWRTKNHRAHLVPLSDEALAILESVKQREGGVISSSVAEWAASRAGPKRRCSSIPVSQQLVQRLALRVCRRGGYMICGGLSSPTSTNVGSLNLMWSKPS